MKEYAIFATPIINRDAKKNCQGQNNPPAAFCHCGHSQHKPFCDKSHTKTDWCPTLKESNIVYDKRL
ncbi:CDGSH iron-sulfur domain-containing protein [Odoribacter lunatus]|uniref:CDGSH iron-sulfur domain-containing protein n=1 Tax=Odoribacter lunatus TaxID=2941335 RepID=UPI00203B5202|nr:CDGSH iron-sulfur domain-containing protein [Odoribacter lunatus]